MIFPTVDIFYPTYKNIDTFEFVLRSCLEQDYDKIRIHVYDNAYSEGYLSTSDLIKSINDRRINYHRNLVNFGAWINYAQILSEMKKTQLAVCLSADIGFAKSGLSTMVDALLKTGASVVYPSSFSYSYGDARRDALDLRADNYLNVLRRFPGKTEIAQPGIDLIQEFYSSDNLNGEYSCFSFFGALVATPVLNAVGPNFLKYRYHGFEHYLSMDLSINSAVVTRLAAPCLQAVVGSPRIGGTERPVDDFTRLEPIVAGTDFLKDRYLLLQRYFGDIEPFFMAQINRCRFFRENFRGYEVEIASLIKFSEAHIPS